MLIQNLQLLFERDLNKLEEELLAYKNEKNIWVVNNGIKNSAGNLCLHLLGNLQHYIGFRLGKIEYQRDRPVEFSSNNIPVENIIKLIDHTQLVLKTSFSNLDSSTLANEYPEMVFQESMSVEYFLLHLLAHLNYHLGQINYHRRLIEYS
jgi:uncharacterized damage-inducible protein DinB